MSVMWNELSKRAEAQKVARKGGEEDRGSDGKTAIREIWREWSEIGEQQQTNYLTGTAGKHNMYYNVMFC